MDGKGRALDNQRIERFFRSYKWEKLYLEECETVQQLRQITKEYVEHYNHRRPHQSLDYKHRQSITLEDMTSYWQLYRIMGSAPNPSSPEGSRSVITDRKAKDICPKDVRVKMNSLTLALDILQQSAQL